MSHPGLFSFTLEKRNITTNHLQLLWKPAVDAFTPNFYLPDTAPIRPGAPLTAITLWEHTLLMRQTLWRFNKEQTLNFLVLIKGMHVDFAFSSRSEIDETIGGYQAQNIFYLSLYTRFLPSSPEMLHIKMSLKCHRGNTAFFSLCLSLLFSYVSENSKGSKLG